MSSGGTSAAPFIDNTTLARDLILESDGNIFTIKLDGSDKTYLTNDSPDYSNVLAAWSYDGSKIVYVNTAPNERPYIWTMNADGSDKQQLTFGNVTGGAATFSPDGKSILFSSSATGNGQPLVGLELWVMNADGTDPHPITHTTVSAVSEDGTTPIKWSIYGSYSPDGTKITYASTQSGHSEIWVMNADGSDQRQLTFPDNPNSPDANSPCWSPDGTKIAYAGGAVGVGEFANIFTINPDGSGRSQLTFEPPSSASDDPVWSPDGQEIIFESVREGPLETWVMNADGTGQLALFAYHYFSSRLPITGAEIAIPCLCRGTLILTDRGEVAVEALTVGDRVKTLSGECKPIVWVGFGRDLVTRANHLARPIVVRRGALADSVPRRDLYLTHGHALYCAGVLIPVEHLVNHRSIAWDETARVIEYYHVELADHAVLFAEGAPAETYHDAGNRAVFQNTREGSKAGARKPACAPVLTGGEIVERVWAELFERAGGRLELNTTDDADIHLVIDGRRLDPTLIDDGVYRFAVKQPPLRTLRLCSRSGVPSLLGLGRSDHRPLGAAIKRIILYHAGIPTCFDYDAPQLRQGGCYLPEDGYCWTDGNCELPTRFFTLLNGPFTLLIHTEPHYDMRYPIPARLAQAV